MEQKKYTTRTIRVPLNLQDEDKGAVLDTFSKVSALYRHIVEECCRNRCVNYYSMAVPDRYQSYRCLFPDVPSMLVQQTIKEACTNTRRWNASHKNALWEIHGIRTAYSYPVNKRTMSIRGNLLSFSTTKHRVRTLISIPEWFIRRYGICTNDAQAGSIKLTDSGLYILLQFRIPTASTTADGVIGVDRGLYNLCTLSDGTIYSSKQAVAVKRRYQYLRSKLQQKGTKSAKRHLKKMRGQEARFMSDFNHCVTKRLASRNDVGTYVLEDLRGIRRRRRGRKLNSWLSNWAYYEFEFQLKYKCGLRGIEVSYTDPRYTSQKCSVCGNTDKAARHKSKYVCTYCGHIEHADVNAAKNIRDNYVRHRSEQGVSTARM